MSTSHKKIGVSPAFLISAYGKGFTPENACEGMELVASWGFSNIQIEIFDEEKIPLWLEGNGAKKVRQVQEKLGIKISQLVCHLLIEECTTRPALFADTGVDTMKQIIQIGRELNCIDCITLPIGTFRHDAPSDALDPTSIEAFRKRLAYKLRNLFEPVKEAGYRLAVELLPFNIAGGYEGFLQILKGIESDRLGFLFDTGHAWAAMEDVAAIPTRVGGKIFGTHLCDNFGGESLKLMPGKGNINWKEVINNLKSSKYAGYYDLEIICSQEKVEEEYLTGLEYISSLGIL